MVKKLNFIILFLIGTTFLTLSVQAQIPKLVNVKVSDQIKMKLPNTLFPMTEQDIRAKYISNKIPLAAYISIDKNADFGVNVSNSRWDESDSEMLKKFYKVNIINLHTDVKFLNDGITSYNGQEFVFFEFVSTVEDEDKKKLTGVLKPLKKYHFIQYAIINNKALVFNFSAPIEQMDIYRPILPEVMSSIKIKKTL
jgi:hypothetical protein